MEKNKNNDNSIKRILIIGCLLLIVGLFILYYVTLPIFNFGNIGFYGYLWFFVAFVLSIISCSLSDILIKKNINKTFTKYSYNFFLKKIQKEEVYAENLFDKTTMVIKSILGTAVVIAGFCALGMHNNLEMKVLYTGRCQTKC